jgi:hypothetical protein
MPRANRSEAVPCERRRTGTLAVIAVLLLVGATAAEATLTRDACFARKPLAWGSYRACLAVEDANRLQGRTDPNTCTKKFVARLARISKMAAAQGIACRFRDNGDGTITDYDVALQWELKTTAVGSGENLDDPHDVDNLYQWGVATGGDRIGPGGSAFTSFLATLNDCGLSSHEDGEVGRFGFAGHCDWRLPAVYELLSILDPTAPGCDTGTATNACIDAIFGPTVAAVYWSTTAEIETGSGVWNVDFAMGGTTIRSKSDLYAVRAVRNAGF